VKQYLGEPAWKRLIISHHKNLNRGDFLVDDRSKNGAKDFTAEWIHFGTGKFPDWDTVLEYLKQRY
jgi:5'-nucleotidase